MNQVEVLATGLANDARIRPVPTLSNSSANLTIKLAEDGSAACVVKSCKLLVREHFLCHQLRITRNELNDIRWESCFEEGLVQDVVAEDCVITWLPDHNISQESCHTRKVARNGSEVERGDSIDKAFQWPVLNAVPDTGGIVYRLLSV